MAMKRCPICGEKYSDTYKTCPFCEEEEALQSGSQIRRNTGRGGKRAARSRQPNLLSPILIVLIVIMLALLVYLLFGDQIADRLSGGADGTQDQQVEDVTPEVPDPDGGDGTMPEDDGTGEGTEPNGGAVTTPETDPSGLPETLTIAYMGSPREEFTMSVGDEPIPLTASGGSGTYTWSSSDDGIASVDASGNVTAISAGQATLTVTDGSGKGTCLVRVRGGSTGTATTPSTGTTASGGGSLTAGTAEVVNAGNGVRVRSQPNTSSEILATVPNGATVQVVQSAGNGWYQISFVASGGVTTTGYMLGEYLQNT
ncbi:SH3 domain-containing protein [uncultured Oscillibacter sp.]|uniref:SH3 domain-containing protein n=1 Tax=uncultured Oscillibacter sp. TaxID=876091 RepID=UPI002803EEFE|nr:SH3 domain-containing protein [uncultured Oscillibacter sp.]